MEICCALLCYCKEQIVSPYLVCRVFFLSYCRVYTLQYKVPWGNYCWDLALKSNWTELNWIERQQFDFIYQKSKAPKLLCVHLGMLQTAWQQSGTDCLWQHSERCEINTYLKQEKKDLSEWWLSVQQLWLQQVHLNMNIPEWKVMTHKEGERFERSVLRGEMSEWEWQEIC